MQPRTQAGFEPALHGARNNPVSYRTGALLIDLVTLSFPVDRYETDSKTWGWVNSHLYTGVSKLAQIKLWSWTVGL